MDQILPSTCPSSFSTYINLPFHIKPNPSSPSTFSLLITSISSISWCCCTCCMGSLMSLYMRSIHYKHFEDSVSISVTREHIQTRGRKFCHSSKIALCVNANSSQRYLTSSHIILLPFRLCIHVLKQCYQQ